MKSTLFLAVLLSLAPVSGFAQGFVSIKSTGRGSTIIPRIEQKLATAFPNLSGSQASWTASWLSLSKGTFEVIDHGGGEVYKVEVLGQALYVLEYPVGENGALKLYSRQGRYIAKYEAYDGGSVWSVARE